MNSENFIGLTAPEDMDLGLSETGLLPYVDETMMTMCQDIEMYPLGDQDVGIIPAFAPPPNNQTLDYVDKMPGKIIIKSSYDPTLNEINSSEMEDNTAFDSVSYTDLSNATCIQQEPQNDQISHSVFNASLSNADYEEFDSKEQFFMYMNHQDDIQINRMEIDEKKYNFNEETKPVIDEKPCFFLTPESPCSLKNECEGADAIDVYFCQNNDSNHNPQIRAKKHSISPISSSHKNIKKIGQKQAKPFRSRKTKAEMSAMTSAEKLRRKKSQNRLNVKNCVARKNGCKNEMKECVDLLKSDAKIMKMNNDIRENELLKVDIFKNCPNISPYGSLNQFREILDRKKENIRQEVVDNNSNIELTTERRRQMAKNREYARKCVQKKKDMRKQAEMRSIHIQRRIQLKKRFTEMKEKNANFAVDLRKTMEEEGVEKLREEYNERKKELNKSFEKLFSADETVNLNFHRLASAREEFEKAAEDLRLKNGVIGTLGSRKIRAKQHMELRQHLYHISVYEHQYRREIKLSELADDYIRNTVPMAAPLVTSIPKDMLDELIRSNRTAELEEFHRFVAENYSTDVKETVDK